MRTLHADAASCLLAAAGMIATPVANAQVVPATPNKFTTRDISGAGSTGSAGIGINPRPKPAEKIVRTITYIALTDERQWKSTDGRSLLGKLIAFDDIVVEIKIAAGAKAEPAPPPQMPEKPVIVRDGKARLLVNARPYEVPLDRLGDDDRKLVEGIQSAVDAKSKTQEKK